MAGPMIVSVVIPTYNRCRDIPETLDCLVRQRTDSTFVYEIIVVDNNSKDQTKQVVESYAIKYPELVRYCFEPSQGRSFALNTGIRRAKGQMISIVDDDCLVDPDYLAIIVNSFATYAEEVGIIGGEIAPKWIGSSCPAWLSGLFNQPVKFKNGSFNSSKIGFEGPLGILNLGSDSFILDKDQQKEADYQFFGANMALRKTTIDRYGLFDVRQRYAQDTEICTRLFNAGVKGVYVPRMKVYHKIPAEKAVPEFYYRWWFDRGVYADKKESLSLRSLYKIMECLGKSLWAKNFLEKVHWRNRLHYHWGQVYGSFRNKIASR